MKRVLVLCVAFACGTHEDYTPLIHVNPNAAKRGMMLHGGMDLGATPKAASRVHLMKAGEELGGPNAIGRPGDWLLENDEVAIVIDQLGLGQGVGFAESGGNIVDAADAHVRKDELGQLFTYFGAFPRQGVYTSMTSGVLQDGTAFVEARGHELYEASLVVRTRYTLHSNDRALLIDTSVENASDHVITLPGLGDAMQWGAAEKFAPDRGRAFKGASSGSFVGGIGRFASYAITSTEGSIEATSGSSWTDTLEQGRVDIAPGKNVHYARVFVVGPRADIAGLVAELTKTAGGAVGSVRVGLMGDAGLVSSVPVDAAVAIGDAKGHPLMDLHPDASGALLGELPVGKYELRYLRGGGRGPRGVPQVIEVLAGQESSGTVEVTAPGRMHAQCKEHVVGQKDDVPIPCKATFEGIGTDSPSFGPGSVAGPAKNQVTSLDGNVDVPLSPGKYRLTLSRGPEYALSSIEVEVKPNDSVEACDPRSKCVLKRVVDTTGWLACDFHQHTMLGVDAAVTTGDRVISNVVEGVEVAVASEHNVIADLEPLVREMGLASRMVSIAGDELTTDASRKPWGHANAFPLVVHPELARGGALMVRDRTAKDLFAEIRAHEPNAVIQVNHPRSGTTGYFDLLAFDRQTGTSTDPSYEPRFDAVEVWNGRNVGGRTQVLGDVLALLRTSHPVTLTGDTDTHGIVGQEAGYPRTYVKVAHDDAFESWSEGRTLEIVHALRETREVVATNGPFVRVTAGAAGIGGIAKAQGGKLAVVVTVESAPWVEVTHVAVMRASGGVIAKDVTQHPNALGAVTATVRFDLTFDKDDAFIVVASGDKPLEPVLSGDVNEIKPYALAGAIWVDADSDGHALGR